MATRGRIGIQLSDGSILSVYHHWDSYESWLGRILTTHYNTKELVEQLIDGGDMSCCWTKERWNSDGSSCEVEEYGPQYYEREMDGENPPRYDLSLKTYLESGEEYAYLYKNGEWICWNRHEFDDSKKPEIVKIPEVALAV